MIVVFDLLSAQPAGPYKFHGGGEYIKTVFRYYVSKYGNDDTIYVCLNEKKYIDQWIIDLIKQKEVKVSQAVSIDDIISFLYSFNNNVSIHFFAGLVYAYRNSIFPSNVFKVGTCHGLRAIEKPTDEYQNKYISLFDSGIVSVLTEYAQKYAKNILRKRHDNTYTNSISRFDIIITDSIHSQYSIKLNYADAIKEKRIYVRYPMTQPVPDNTLDQGCFDENYIMLISANRWTKNSYRACMAIDGLYSKGLIRNVRTKVYGNLPKKIRKKLKNHEMFEFYEYVSSEELEKAYANCSVFFYPTLNEGFGNVPMEAMKYGKTCVVSAVCSLPEVYKDSVIYCNPYDLMEMQNRLLQALEIKIDKNIIKERLSYIYSRQISDMDSLCSIIREERNK